MRSFKMTGKIRSLWLVSVVLCILSYPRVSNAFFWSQLWPDTHAGVELIINGDDGEDEDRLTECVNIGQRYPVIGNFTYRFLTGFTESGNILTYTVESDVPRLFLFTGNVSAKGDKTGTTLHYSVWHNGSEVFPRSITGAYQKTANEAINFGSFSFLIGLVENDTLEVRTWSGSANEDVTTTHLTYTITPIERQH